MPAVGVTQDLRTTGIPGTLGLGLTGLSGLRRGIPRRAPENTSLNNLSGEYMILGINLGAGVELTDRLSVGAALTLGNGFEQLGFVGPLVGSAMVNGYALRGTAGVNYELNDCNTVGAYYQSKMDFNYPDAIRVGGNYHDLRIDQPDTFGLGFANPQPDGRRLAPGRQRLLQALGKRGPVPGRVRQPVGLRAGRADPTARPSSAWATPITAIR